jgi:hypothetical protein
MYGTVKRGAACQNIDGPGRGLFTTWHSNESAEMRISVNVIVELHPTPAKAGHEAYQHAMPVPRVDTSDAW